jgi:hypothetical protein
LFEGIQAALEANGKSFNWSPNALATVYVIFSIASNILDKMSMREVGSPYTDLLSVLILPIIYVTLLKPQKAINISQDDPEGICNSHYTIGNYAWIVLGILLWALFAFGFLIMSGVVNVE